LLQLTEHPCSKGVWKMSGYRMANAGSIMSTSGQVLKSKEQQKSLNMFNSINTKKTKSLENCKLDYVRNI
jgi:hypothetical protein